MKNEGYISNTQNLLSNETSLKTAKEGKRLRVYTIVVFSFVRTFAPSF